MPERYFKVPFGHFFFTCKEARISSQTPIPKCHPPLRLCPYPGCHRHRNRRGGPRERHLESFFFLDILEYQSVLPFTSGAAACKG